VDKELLRGRKNSAAQRRDMKKKSSKVVVQERSTKSTMRIRSRIKGEARVKILTKEGRGNASNVIQGRRPQSGGRVESTTRTRLRKSYG